MPEKKGRKIRRETLVEKLVRRSLETVGGGVDSVFGRGKKPDALPATSDLSERLRRMIDSQAQINKEGRKLAPHLISLKYAWGQTSDEFEIALRRLKNELLIVAIDFINDNRFATLAPVKIESKADILTTGFTMSIGFDEASLREAEQVEIPVEIYAKLLPDYQRDATPPPLEIMVTAVATFPDGRTRNSVLHFIPEKKATLTVGRIKEIDLYLDDDSVSKHHASLAINAEGVLRVADIGSTNGTFLNGTRISYGKAYEVERDTLVGFGDVIASFEWEVPQPEPAPETNQAEAQFAPSENVEPPGADESGIKIGVKSVTIQSIQDEDEPATVFGVRNDIGEKDAEHSTLNRNLGEDEPETLNKQPEDDPETFNQQRVSEHKTIETPDVEQAPSSLATIESATDQPLQNHENNDFTQSLETNVPDENLADKSLVGFDSLLGKSGGLAVETDEITEDKRHDN